MAVAIWLGRLLHQSASGYALPCSVIIYLINTRQFAWRVRQGAGTARQEDRVGDVSATDDHTQAFATVTVAEQRRAETRVWSGTTLVLVSVPRISVMTFADGILRMFLQRGSRAVPLSGCIESKWKCMKWASEKSCTVAMRYSSMWRWSHRRKLESIS